MTTAPASVGDLVYFANAHPAATATGAAMSAAIAALSSRCLRQADRWATVETCGLVL